MALWRAVRGVFVSSDDDTNKKDDDHRATSSMAPGLPAAVNWSAARPPRPRWMLKRVAVLLGVAVLIYLFIHNMPNLGPRMFRPDYGSQDSSLLPSRPPPVRGQSRPKVPPQDPKNRGLPLRPQAHEYTYDEPPKFLELGASLMALGNTRGGSYVNNNVLFAAASFKSAAMLLPLACQMGREARNYVHFALMARSEINIATLLQVNGVDESCNLIVHDARPEFAAKSTENRMERSVFRAFLHVQRYMHPQAVIIDGGDDEERFFHRSARSQAKAIGIELIEIPPHAVKRLNWMIKLDSAALKSWSKNYIDIVIQARQGASGSLTRLLRSLSKADYTSSALPHLTIELPRDVDEHTMRFLENFQWPPEHVHNPTNMRYMTLRHSVGHHKLDEKQTSIRFLESFWPQNSRIHHVLVLSPEAELSPHFLHYLKYTMLEYRYSMLGQIRNWDFRLFGISLEQPLTQLNGQDTLNPPSKLEESGDRVSSAFAWEAPASHAMLIFGEKWIELHDFVSQSLDKMDSTADPPMLLSKKLLGDHHPSWLEYALKLAQVRGYWTLYPGEEGGKNLATVHADLRYEVGSLDPPKRLADDASETEIWKAMHRFRDEQPEDGLYRVSLLEGLSGNGTLVPLEDLPLLSWDGKETDVRSFDAKARNLTLEFKESVGKCSPKDLKIMRRLSSVRDLFCKT